MDKWQPGNGICITYADVRHTMLTRRSIDPNDKVPHAPCWASSALHCLNPSSSHIHIITYYAGSTLVTNIVVASPFFLFDLILMFILLCYGHDYQL